MFYDQHGRKTAMIDPDKGRWEYEYNDFGELIEQRNANHQKTTMVYDVLGRMTRRMDYEGMEGEVMQSESTWLFDPANDQPIITGHHSTLDGKPSSKVETYFYDSYGRASSKVTTINAEPTLTERTTYDQFGRVFQVFDASGNNHGIEHGYNEYGYLDTVKEAQIVNSPGASTSIPRVHWNLWWAGLQCLIKLGVLVMSKSNEAFSNYESALHEMKKRSMARSMGSESLMK